MKGKTNDTVLQLLPAGISLIKGVHVNNEFQESFDWTQPKQTLANRSTAETWKTSS